MWYWFKSSLTITTIVLPPLGGARLGEWAPLASAHKGSLMSGLVHAARTFCTRAFSYNLHMAINKSFAGSPIFPPDAYTNVPPLPSYARPTQSLVHFLIGINIKSAAYLTPNTVCIIHANRVLGYQRDDNS